MIHPYLLSPPISLLLFKSMARLFSQTLTRTSPSYQSLIHGGDHHLSPRILTQRHRSSQSGNAQVMEVEVDSSEASSDAEVLGGIRKLEDFIHSIIVKRSAPDWLPFVPGASYWVPPPPRGRPHGMIEALGKLSAPFALGDEFSSRKSVRGWPSSAFYNEDTSTTPPVPVEMVVEVQGHGIPENAPQAEDEES